MRQRFNVSVRLGSSQRRMKMSLSSLSAAFYIFNGIRHACMSSKQRNEQMSRPIATENKHPASLDQSQQGHSKFTNHIGSTITARPLPRFTCTPNNLTNFPNTHFPSLPLPQRARLPSQELMPPALPIALPFARSNRRPVAGCACLTIIRTHVHASPVTPFPTCGCADPQVFTL